MNNNTDSSIITVVTVVGANGTMGRNVFAIIPSFGHAKVYMVSRSIGKSEKAREGLPDCKSGIFQEQHVPGFL